MTEKKELRRRVQRGSRLSAGVVVVRPDGDEWLFLLLRAYRYWDFPKGMLEPGETPMQAALREVKEETTLTGLKFFLGEQFIETGPYSHGKTARYYLAVSDVGLVSLPVNAELGRAEHNEYRWVPAREARALLSPRVLDVLNWAETLLRPENFV
jgi:8-oxo-dGTP pyrophosphatase MutT (NUDIX family)